MLIGLSGEELGRDDISMRAARLGAEVAELWRILLHQAQSEIASRDQPTDAEES